MTRFETFRPTINGHSPWGYIEHMTTIADGIVRVSTASHGGIWLSPARRAQLAEQSPHLLRAVENYSWVQKPAWWEEDCEATIPLLAFWDDLPPSLRRTSYYADLVRIANRTYGFNLSEVA